ncbi:MAG: laminin B domain-containing protein [Candidatus Promineifilaceae bacterium]
MFFKFRLFVLIGLLINIIQPRTIQAASQEYWNLDQMSSSANCTSDFSEGTDGWYGSGDTATNPTYIATGGNPGGHLQLDDRATNGVWYWNAPTKYLGDALSAYGHNLKFDLSQSHTDSQIDRPDVILSSSTMQLHFDTAYNPNKTWTSYAVPLIETTGWVVDGLNRVPTSAEFQAVLADLQDFRIRGEYRDGPDTGRLDNVVFETAGCVGQSHSACTSDFSEGADGWYGSGDAEKIPTYIATGGNPGGHLQLEDMTAGQLWYWNAPTKYLGDASSAYGHNLKFDLSQSHADRQIDGPDVILNASTMQLHFDTAYNPNTTWTSYTVPLMETTGWVVNGLNRAPTSAEFQAVLADLQGLRIRGEYRSGPDSSRLDNVVFETAGCAEQSLYIVVLGFDNNLSGYMIPTMDEIVSASQGNPQATTVVIADQLGNDNTTMYVVENGLVTTLDGLPNSDGEVDGTLREYDVTDGTQLGPAILWARETYSTTQTVFSFISHGTFAAPDIDYAAISDASQVRAAQIPGLPSLPTRWTVTPDLTDETSKSIITPRQLAEALRIGTPDGSDPIDVVDTVHCFSSSIEQFYELSPYADVLTGSPNYAYFAPEMVGRSVANLNSTNDAATLADTLLAGYHDVLREGDALDGDGSTVEHPHLLVAVDADKLAAVKTDWDRVSYYLWQDFDTNKLLQARLNSRSYDTDYCSVQQDFVLDKHDALVDMRTFALALANEYGFLSDVNNAALDTVSSINSAVLTTYHAEGQPWFATTQSKPTWEFSDPALSGLSMIADLHGTSTADEVSLAWQTAYMDKTPTTGNPHPYKWLQGDFHGKNWADVFQRYWDEKDVTTSTEMCAPDLLTPRQYSDSGIDRLVLPRFANVESSTDVSAVISTSELVIGLPILITMMHDAAVVLTERVTLDRVRAGEEVQIKTSKQYTPTSGGLMTIDITVDNATNIVDLNPSNDTLIWSRPIDPVRSEARPTVSAMIASGQEWIDSLSTLLDITVTPADPTQFIAEIFTYTIDSDASLHVPRSASIQRLDLDTPTLQLPADTQPGLVVAHIWARTELGGLSAEPAIVTYNYVPANATLPVGSEHVFAFDADAGEDVTLNLSGTNVELCLWEPNNFWSTLCTTDNVLSVANTKSGEYVMAVRGVSSAETTYTLTGERDGSPIRSASNVEWVSRPRPDLVKPISDLPTTTTTTTTTPPLPNDYEIFVPIVIRGQND